MRRFWIGALLVAGLLAPGVSAVSARQSRPDPTVAYTVRAGDTLWKIASRAAPGEDPRRTVHELMKLNQLRSPSLYPGQRLQLPAR